MLSNVRALLASSRQWFPTLWHEPGAGGISVLLILLHGWAGGMGQSWGWEPVAAG